MKSKDLLEAMSDIREEYILEADLEAAPSSSADTEKAGSPKTSSAGTGKPFALSRFSRKFGLIAAALLCILGIGLYQKMELQKVPEQSARPKEKAEDAALPEVSGSFADGEKELSVNKNEAVEESFFIEAAKPSAMEAEEAEEDVSLAQEAETDSLMENTGILWVRCESLAEAEEMAGFSIKIPQEFMDPIYSEPEFSASKAAALEVRYLDFNGIEGGIIRKTTGAFPAEKDTFRYTSEETVKLEDREVTLKENDGIIRAACWTQNDYSYEVLLTDEGFGKESLLALIREIE